MKQALATPPAAHSRSVRWLLGLGLVAMVAIGLVLLFLLTQATTNRELYEQNYARLFAVNVVVALLLLGVIAWIAVRLVRRVVQKKFGSRLLVKLAAVFALAGFAPGMLIYVVSYQFVTRSIESWFDVKVEGALNAGLNLGRTTLEALSNDLSAKARAGAAQLSDTPDFSAALPLERARVAVGADDLMLWGGAGRLIAAAGQSRYQLNPELPSAQQFRAARDQRVITWIEGLDDAEPGAAARVKALALITSDQLGLFNEPRYLLAVKALPDTLVANALAVMQANREYQERALARDGLRRMYIGTLTLSLFMAVFGAVLLAVVLGNQLARPLLLLADGVREVAAGDLTPKSYLSGSDELDGLTRSFAQMTQQLADARQSVQTSMAQVSAAHANLQTILDNLTAGVMVLDANGLICAANPGATRILRVPLAAHQGQALAQIEGLQTFGQQVQEQFDSFFSPHGERTLDHWQQSFELGGIGRAQSGRPAHDVITLVTRGAELPGEQRLLVFDDISEIVSAQRSQAWGEVARRLAHEIKNPLTPIQLSAERLEMKLTGKLGATEQAMLTKSVKTIVDQVDAMKRLVNEFRDYARLPAAELKPLNLNELVIDVLHLYADDLGQVPVKTELDPDCPYILGDTQQLRQVLHNLLQNAQDATLSAGHADAAHAVLVKTQWQANARRVRLLVQDCGTGFPDHILKRAFEPYVTTKDKGTGLGLAVVKKIADEHASRVAISNRVHHDQIVGAQVSVSFAIAPASGLQTS
ncbi:MAG: ATP-binding protein [Rhodoferax sp.]|uniref:sensor histidine kinase n=1 Tax=Rhodoferax sp. TaxID=50421 RepID=UPI0008D6525D|nr:ATP-binding protein [Rhodoferax sp.]MDP2677096.1 ATP-binding protein [Rhodoferax sp.]OGB54062.1 MAG: PAS domain-containing sensor histidine kinase [Burkholderiales bacterium RIFOXYD12_FULL_59_19]